MGVHYNITIVPEYSSNRSLEASVRNHFSQLIDGSCYRGNKTLRIIVFRPTGRPADEFRENVLPVLRGCDEGVYLFAAFSGGYKNISDLVPESETHRVRSVEPIYIQAGELVSQDSANYTNNQTAFRKMAELMCRQHGLMMNRQEVQGWNEYPVIGFLFGIFFYVLATLRRFYHRLTQDRG